MNYLRSVSEDSWRMDLPPTISGVVAICSEFMGRAFGKVWGNLQK